MSPIGTARTTQIVRIWAKGWQATSINHHFRPAYALARGGANDGRNAA